MTSSTDPTPTPLPPDVQEMVERRQQALRSACPHGNGVQYECHLCWRGILAGLARDVMGRQAKVMQRFRDMAGHHEGPHSEITPPTFSGSTVSECALCYASYMEAEAMLDEAIREGVKGGGE